jgi:hypothetical protein
MRAKMRNWLTALAAAAAISAAGGAEDAPARRIRERFDAARPTAKSLAFYTLDWEMSLAAAKSRAAREGRPILLILNTNITAGTNFFSGHT